MRTPTYRRIDYNNIVPASKEKLLRDREMFVRNQKLFTDMRRAYGKKQITREELLDLHRRIKAGDEYGAKREFQALIDRGLECV
jgi:hypothetical protein